VSLCGRRRAQMTELEQPAASPSQTAQVMNSQDVDLLRKDIRSKKKQLIAANLKVKEAEATKFWPSYDQYTQELINDKYAESRFIGKPRAHLLGFLFACRRRRTYELHKAVNGSMISRSRQSEVAFAVRKTALSKIGDVELSPIPLFPSHAVPKPRKRTLDI
jgi:hypothetical protein